ncbi:hypothetical protein TUM4438_39700 [Shewanella sairae]|uniref:Peroxisome membrane anchor protein Pex14p N-terminal domain-containing protein n=1 Tax=Shewanella sairae TaxID=190310 RepID=A0ABQ4PQ48_9GAMM|nr:hypothetical protein [Shewanella sairae]MCL1132090.1 peroxisomal membrane protein PEX14 [Shewanella sairae]GIU51142.1 hypothetical protein TUM4438_39700 [Shewanella sairae]
MNTSMSLTSKIDLLRSKGLSDQEIDQLLSTAPSAAPVVAPQSQSESLPESLKTFAPLFADKPAEQWNEQVEDVLSKDKKFGQLFAASILIFVSTWIATMFFGLFYKYGLAIMFCSIFTLFTYFFAEYVINGWYYNKLRFFFKKTDSSVTQQSYKMPPSSRLTPWIIWIAGLFSLLFMIAGINDNQGLKDPSWLPTLLGVVFIISAASGFLYYVNKPVDE